MAPNREVRGLAVGTKGGWGAGGRLTAHASRGRGGLCSPGKEAKSLQDASGPRAYEWLLSRGTRKETQLYSLDLGWVTHCPIIWLLIPTFQEDRSHRPPM